MTDSPAPVDTAKVAEMMEGDDQRSEGNASEDDTGESSKCTSTCMYSHVVD